MLLSDADRRCTYLRWCAPRATVVLKGLYDSEKPTTASSSPAPTTAAFLLPNRSFRLFVFIVSGGSAFDLDDSFGYR